MAGVEEGHSWCDLNVCQPMQLQATLNPNWPCVYKWSLCRQDIQSYSEAVVCLWIFD